MKADPTAYQHKEEIHYGDAAVGNAPENYGQYFALFLTRCKTLQSSFQHDEHARSVTNNSSFP